MLKKIDDFIWIIIYINTYIQKMATLEQRLERIIINLKVLSKLEVSDRPIFKNKSVSIRKYIPFITGIIRTAASEGRADVSDGLKLLKEDTDRLVSDYMNSSELQNPNVSDFDRDAALTAIISLNRLKVEIPLAYNTSNKGFNALKETYTTDPDLSANIENIIEGFKSTVRKISIVISNMTKKFGLESKIVGDFTKNSDSNEIKNTST
jgi:hypothetical protein